MNTGDITAIATAFFSNAYGIQARANAGNSPISINNSCNLLVQGSTDASGIFALSESVAGGGVNFFNPSANTSLFAKVDVTFGEDLDGVGGKAGMRVAW